MTQEKVENDKNFNNSVYTVGRFLEDFTFHRERHGIKFYRNKLVTKRMSGVEDEIIVDAPEYAIDFSNDYKKCPVEVDGRFESFNSRTKDGNHLELFIYTNYIKELEGDIPECDSNRICLRGYICKKPIYRETPKGRKIADLLIAVNRAYDKSDYIPCIVWGEYAEKALELEIGDEITASGRMQSRPYLKQKENQLIEKTAYEVSISKFLLH